MDLWDELQSNAEKVGQVFGSVGDLMTSDAGEDPETTMSGAAEYQKKQVEATEVPQNVGGHSSQVSFGGMQINPLYLFGGLLVVGGLFIAAKS